MTNKRSRRYLLVLVSLTIVFISSSARAADTWDPRHTWVFMVGLVTWQDEDSFPAFPAEDRKDAVLLDTFKKRGVPASQIVYLHDKAATTTAVETRFVDFLRRPAASDLVIVYFEGHGYKTDDDNIPYLATYDVTDDVLGWKFRSIPDNIEKYFRGDRTLIMLDNCYSGSMANAVKAVKRRVSFAVLASSMASQESTGRWTYTEALINGFSGAPFTDLNHDGRVTFREMASNAEADMLFGEEQVATTAFTGAFDPDTVISTAPPASSPHIGERVEALSEGDAYRGYIVGARDGEFRVHYYGYEASYEEWVSADDIRVPHSNSPYHVGDRVEVNYKRQWFPAHILDIKGGSHYVSYDDYDKDENEWVPTTRIRKLTKQRRDQ